MEDVQVIISNEDWRWGDMGLGWCNYLLIMYAYAKQGGIASAGAQCAKACKETKAAAPAGVPQLTHFFQAK